MANAKDTKDLKMSSSSSSSSSSSTTTTSSESTWTKPIGMGLIGLVLFGGYGWLSQKAKEKAILPEFIYPTEGFKHYDSAKKLYLEIQKYSYLDPEKFKSSLIEFDKLLLMQHRLETGKLIAGFGQRTLAEELAIIAGHAFHALYLQAKTMDEKAVLVTLDDRLSDTVSIHLGAINALTEDIKIKRT